MEHKYTIICPKCGKIDNYKIMGTFQKYVTYDRDGNTLAESSFEKLDEGQPVCPECASKVLISSNMDDMMEHIPNMMLSELGLSTRAFRGITRGLYYKQLENPSIKLAKPSDPTILEIVQYVTEDDLLKRFRNVGQVTCNEILTKFNLYGIKLAKEFELSGDI